MNTSDIISSILAALTFIGIVVALGLGVWSIFETKKLNKIRYKESVLDDILKWLFDVSECESKYSFANAVEMQRIFESERYAKTYHSITSANIANECVKLSNKGRMFAGLFRNKEDSLPNEILKLVRQLKILEVLHDKYRGAFLDIPDDFRKITDLLNKQDDEVNKLKGINKPLTAIKNLVSERKYSKTLL